MSRHGRGASRRLRLAADNHDSELGDQGGDCAQSSQKRSHDGANGSDGHRDLDERVAMLVLDHDALDVALMDQVANLSDEVAADDMNFFHKTLEVHSLEYVDSPSRVPTGEQSVARGPVRLN